MESLISSSCVPSSEKPGEESGDSQECDGTACWSFHHPSRHLDPRITPPSTLMLSIPRSPRRPIRWLPGPATSQSRSQRIGRRGERGMESMRVDGGGYTRIEVAGGLMGNGETE
ncbi:unnamed protein product [Pleuronectes platessa]|uniref:Uncharacterized protein n=1 Tax=Pleuronectes platessa TaxID=8262 RepID=A0A9N7ZA69_PLEPL|nr:unnamed protein product [Pleuronectes platessa]